MKAGRGRNARAAVMVVGLWGILVSLERGGRTVAFYSRRSLRRSNGVHDRNGAAGKTRVPAVACNRQAGEHFRDGRLSQDGRGVRARLRGQLGAPCARDARLDEAL